MKKTLSLISIAVLILGLLGSCAKNDDAKIKDLEQKVATVEELIAGINTAISDLSAIRQEIQDLKNKAVSKEDLEKLEAADATLSSRIDALEQAATDLSKYAEKEWVEAKFATEAALTAAKADLVNLGTTVAEIKKSLNAMIQDITIIPAYSDGSVKVVTDTLEDGTRFYHMLLDLSIDPISSAGSLEQKDFTVYMTKVQTKSASDVEKLEPEKILDFSVDKEKGIISIKADVSKYGNSGLPYSVAVNVNKPNDTFTSSFTSNYVNVTFPPRMVQLWENTEGIVPSSGWHNTYKFVLKGSPADKQKEDGSNDYLAAFDADQWDALKNKLIVAFSDLGGVDISGFRPRVTTFSWDPCYRGTTWDAYASGESYVAKDSGESGGYVALEWHLAVNIREEARRMLTA